MVFKLTCSLVPDTRFVTECESIVQHVCEEHYKVAVPKPVVFPVPIFAPVPPTSPPPPPPPTYGPALPLGRTKRQLVLSDPALVPTTKIVPPPPSLSHQELPAPPGCRSVVTQKCHKVPEVYNKKVPREECREVPGVACHLELQLVEQPKCYAVPEEECDDILKEIPYLVEEEECNQVPRLECNTVGQVRIIEMITVGHCT